MKESRPVYENGYAEVRRETVKGKVRFVVYNKRTRSRCFTYRYKEEAIKYAKHLETYRRFWEE